MGKLARKQIKIDVINKNCRDKNPQVVTLLNTSTGSDVY